MSYVFSASDRLDARPTDLNLLIAEKGDLRVSLRIIAASSVPDAMCEQWLTSVLAYADRWIDISNPAIPSAILMLTNGQERDLELLGELRALQPTATIFAVTAEYRPETAAALLCAGADDLWHCTMQAPEAWARLSAAVRRRGMTWE